MEVTVEAFRRFVLANSSAVEQIGEAVARRRAELAQHSAAGAAAAPAEPSNRLLDRIRHFLRLTAG